MPSILVVDDDSELLFLVTQIMAFHNMEVKGITYGEEVLSSLEAEHFDIILMDIFIGTQDGRQLTRQIKTDSRFADIPILLYSAGIIDEKSIRECGADGFVSKPFDMDYLVSRLNELLLPGPVNECA